MLKASVFRIAFPQEDSSSPSVEELEVATKMVRESKECEGIKWGDLVINDTVAGYRNDGVMIFDGERVRDLANYPDDYGNVPEEFKVLQPHPLTKELIPTQYWTDHKSPDDRQLISHDYLVWFDHTPFKNELVENVRFDKEFPYSDREVLYTSFTLGDKKLYLVFNLREYLEGGDTEYTDSDGERAQVFQTFKERLESNEMWSYICVFEDFIQEATDDVLYMNMDSRENWIEN